MSGVYVHVPFCRSRCSYCDFSVAIGKPDVGYVDLIRQEFALSKWSGVATTLYFGGGTPSSLPIRDLAELVKLFPVEPGAEITAEVNPEDVSREWAKGAVAAGVNRLSLGVQSFDPAILEWFRRGHRPEDVVRAWAILRSVGFSNLSIDLIFGAPCESSTSWGETLERAIALEPEHVSVYALTIESGTPLRGMVLDEEVQAERYRLAERLLSAAGYRWYEISNWAKPGFASRHNLGYWTGGDYLGVGPSAHSRQGAARFWNVNSYPRYRQRILSGLSAMEGVEILDEAELIEEAAYLRLRTSGGTKIKELPRWSWGLLEADGDRAILSLDGRLQLDGIFARLAADGVILGSGAQLPSPNG